MEGGGGEERALISSSLPYLYIYQQRHSFYQFSQALMSPLIFFPQAKSEWVACDVLFQNFPAIGAVVLSFQVSTL